MKNKQRIKIVIGVLFVVFCLALSRWPGVAEYMTLEAINAHLDVLSQAANSTFGPLLFILVTVIAIILQLPAVLFVVVAGLVYDLLPGFLYCWTGCVLGTTGTFLIARFFLRDYFLPKLENSPLKTLLGPLESSGIFTMIIIRALMFMFPPLNWLLGVSSLKTRDFLVGNMIGIAPVMLGIMIAVKKLRSIRSGWDLLQPETMLVIVAFLAAVGFIVFIRKRLLMVSNKAELNK